MNNSKFLFIDFDEMNKSGVELCFWWGWWVCFNEWDFERNGRVGNTLSINVGDQIGVWR